MGLKKQVGGGGKVGVKKTSWKKVGVKKMIIKVRKKVGGKNREYQKNRGKKLLPNIGQNMLWWEAHTYKWLVSIFEEVASELLFGPGVKCLQIQLLLIAVSNKYWVTNLNAAWLTKSTYKLLL